jgi:nucleoside-diphosphate-sugar epimerase
VAASGADYSIVRPSLLEGPGGYGARWLAVLGRLPVHFVPADAAGRIAVMDVRDLGSAIAALCEKPGDDWREVELGGLAPVTMAGYLAMIRARSGAAPALQLAVPKWLARVASHLFDLAHFSPFSFGHLELMRRDNVPSPNRIGELIGRATPRLQPRPRVPAFAAASLR